MREIPLSRTKRRDTEIYRSRHDRRFQKDIRDTTEFVLRYVGPVYRPFQPSSSSLLSLTCTCRVGV
eukprot:601756-Amorphochlora_amoeboformis.AAC.1